MKHPFMVPSDPMDRMLIILLCTALIGTLPGCGARRIEIIEGQDSLDVPAGHIKSYSLADALKARAYYRAYNDQELLLKTLYRIVALAPDQQTLESVLFELGELLLAGEKYEEAQKILGEYVSYFPGSDRIVEARFNEFDAYYRDIRAYFHDQTKTRDALQRGVAFINEFEGESSHDQYVHTAIADCYEHLFDHEMGIAEFYLNKYAYTEAKSTLVAAEKRLEKIYLELGAHLTATHREKLADFESRLREQQRAAAETLTISPSPTLAVIPSDA